MSSFDNQLNVKQQQQQSNGDQQQQQQDISKLKRNMTLDFNSGIPSNKKSKFIKNCVLESPDLKMLKLASPDLERLITGMPSTGATPTPGLMNMYFKEDQATDEQREYASGFLNALNQLHETEQQKQTVENQQIGHQQAGMPHAIVSQAGHQVNGHQVGVSQSGHHMSSESSADLTIADNNFIPTTSAYEYSNSIFPMVKIEPQANIIPTTLIAGQSSLNQPQVKPINLADQEKIKLERKRLRNRIAASKCRKRKLERISRLEEKVRMLKGENGELGLVVGKLRDQVCGLKQQVMEHVKNGCQLMINQ